MTIIDLSQVLGALMEHAGQAPGTTSLVLQLEGWCNRLKAKQPEYAGRIDARYKLLSRIGSHRRMSQLPIEALEHHWLELVIRPERELRKLTLVEALVVTEYHQTSLCCDDFIRDFLFWATKHVCHRTLTSAITNLHDDWKRELAPYLKPSKQQVRDYRRYIEKLNELYHRDEQGLLVFGRPRQDVTVN